MSLKLELKYYLIILALICSLTGLCQNNYFPTRTEWQSRLPKEMGLDPLKVEAAVSFAMQNEYSGSKDLRIAILGSFAREPYMQIVGPTKERGGPAGIIVRNGYLTASWGDLDRVDMTFSVTKSYLSTTVGLAFDDGLINLSDPVAKYVWDGTFAGPHNSKITWQHLLSQSSDWSGSLFGVPDWSDRPPREGSIDDWKNRKLNEPGTFFKYNDIRVNLLAYSILQVVRQPLPELLKERIMDPIEASSTWRWYGYETSWVDIDGSKVQSVSGGGHFGGGMFINTYDQAKFGLLFLRDGNWNGQQLISRKWIDLLRQPSEANESYGYMWWLNKGDRKWEGVSESIFYAAGFGGNYIIVDKEHDLLIVTRWLEPSKLGEFVKMVIDSLEK